MQALIIVDMQQAPLSDPTKYDTKGIINRINLLAKKVRKSHGSVIFIQHDGNAQEQLEPDTVGWQIVDTLIQHKTDTVIRKTTNDAFYKTPLGHFLQENNIDSLIFCGWATDFCVDTSVKAAISREYKVTVAADCHTLNDRDQIAAPDLINYFNALWANMLSPTQPVTVKLAADLYS
ncbi:MAG: isochorismatase family protein [Oceanospirillaceae bacterium]|nr:isochorismatase family protein [Oceanospirillaceae bacterium]